MMLDKDPGAQALIFDIDGTLADTMPVHYNAWMTISRRKGFVYPRKLFDELAGVPTVKIVPILNEKLGLALDTAETVREKEAEFLSMIGDIRPIQPVVDVVLRYHGKIPMSLGTGGRRDIAELTIKAVGLSGYFDILVAAEDVERHKPAPDTFLECARRMHAAPPLCQVFEDSIAGLASARAAGMITTDVNPFL